jgi:hypothetical protein
LIIYDAYSRRLARKFDDRDGNMAFVYVCADLSQ